jgi:hypothetical protein
MTGRCTGSARRDRIKGKNHRRHLAAARERRDRDLEQFSANAILLPATWTEGKYDVSPALEGGFGEGGFHAAGAHHG